MWMGTGGSKAHVVVDVTGYYVPGPAGSTFVAAHAGPVVDTRFGTGLSGSFVSGTPRTFQVTGHGGVPVGATAVTGNLVAVDPNSAGYLALGPTVSATPSASSLNTTHGDTRGASVTMPLDGSGRLALVWKGTPGSRTHVVFDVTGYFSGSGAGATYFPIDSSRVLDTRFANGLSGPFGAKVVRALQANGRGAVPLDAVAVTGGAAVITPSGAGWLIVGPGGSPLGTTASRSTCRRATSGRTASRRGPGREARSAWSSEAVRDVGERRPRHHGLLPLTGPLARSDDRRGTIGSVPIAARRYTGPAMSTPRRRAATSTLDLATAGRRPPGRSATAPGSSCRRTTRPRTSAASPRRSSRRCPARRSSSSTTARPTAPARSPTSWRPSTRASGSATARPSRASAGPTSTASASPSTAAPRSSSRWMPTGRTTRRSCRR